MSDQPSVLAATSREPSGLFSPPYDSALEGLIARFEAPSGLAFPPDPAVRREVLLYGLLKVTGYVLEDPHTGMVRYVSPRPSFPPQFVVQNSTLVVVANGDHHVRGGEHFLSVDPTMTSDIVTSLFRLGYHYNNSLVPYHSTPHERYRDESMEAVYQALRRFSDAVTALRRDPSPGFQRYPSRDPQLPGLVAEGIFFVPGREPAFTLGI